MKAILVTVLLCVVRVKSTCDESGAAQCFAALGMSVGDADALCSNIDAVEIQVNTCLAMLDTCEQSTQDTYQQVVDGIESAKQLCGAEGCENTDFAVVGAEIGQCFETLSSLGNSVEPCPEIQNALDCADTAIGTCDAFEDSVKQIFTALAPYASHCDPELTFQGQPIRVDTENCDTSGTTYLGCILPLQPVFEDIDTEDGGESVHEACKLVNPMIAEIEKVHKCVGDVITKCPDTHVDFDGLPQPQEMLDVLGNFTTLCSPDCRDLETVVNNAEACTAVMDQKYGVTTSTFNPTVAKQQYPNFCSDSEQFRQCFESAFESCPEQLAPMVTIMELSEDNKPLTGSFRECSLEFSKEFEPKPSKGTTLGVSSLLVVMVFVFMGRYY